MPGFLTDEGIHTNQVNFYGELPTLVWRNPVIYRRMTWKSLSKPSDSRVHSPYPTTRTRRNNRFMPPSRFDAVSAIQNPAETIRSDVADLMVF